MIRRRSDGRRRRTWPLLLVATLTLGIWTVVGGARAATPSHTPFGRLDVAAQSGTSITVNGWAIDPDTRSSIKVDVYLDGHGRRLTANAIRTDVARVYPRFGDHHGYSTQYPAIAAGKHTLCAYAIDYGLGTTNPTLGCRTITVTYDPFGSISTATQFPGGFTATGWAIDRDKPRPALAVRLSVDGKLTSAIANLSRPDVAKRYPTAGAAHGFSITAHAAEGAHHVCLLATNIGLGANASVACRTVTLNFSPVGAITSLTQAPGGFRVQGWAFDPDTSGKITVAIYSDNVKVGTTTANLASSAHNGHGYGGAYPLGTGKIPPGSHTICVHGANFGAFGSSRSVACKTMTFNFNPFGAFDKVERVGGLHLRVTGWAVDPDTAKPSTVRVTIDGKVVGTPTAAGVRSDVGRKYPAFGSLHGLSVLFGANPGEHHVCATAVNTLNGTGDTSLGCRIINAIHPVAPSVPRAVAATGGFGAARVTWSGPASDGGAPYTSFTVTASHGGRSLTVGAGVRAVTVTGLAANTHYSFAVVARNVAGTSAPGQSRIVVTQASPPAQTSPAPISTSRYVRNISGSSSIYLNRMRAEGITDAQHNPSGHGYLVLLDIGGQDQSRGGVLLSATTRFVSYADLVRDLNAYVDGYASQQKPSAPVTIALGTNNDMDVSVSSGASWARNVVNPIAAHAAGHTGLKIAGANDIEPGFRATYTQTKSWLSGYLGATPAPFVFNGSADGCAWTATGRGCNNGWTMAGLYHLSAGAAPTRIVNLPQVYNNTMAAQWKFISLTGVGARQPKINFGGALTEWTACAQAGGCGSLTGRNAWIQMWGQLQSHPALRTPSLPYSTDLRIDR